MPENPGTRAVVDDDPVALAGTSKVTITVVDSEGGPAADGSTVTWAASAGVLIQKITVLNDGAATALLVAPGEAQVVNITVVVAHGTDTLEQTGEALHRELTGPRVPVILTGAMRPFEFRDSDAAQNVTEALLACRMVEPGVYVVMHNRVLRFPGVTKNREGLSFEKKAL